MRIGYAEFLLVFAAITSFHDLKWGLAIAGLSLLVAFFRFALDVQEKKEAREKQENAAKLLNEQAGELGEALSSLFKNIKSEVSSDKYNKYKDDNKKYH